MDCLLQLLVSLLKTFYQLQKSSDKTSSLATRVDKWLTLVRNYLDLLASVFSSIFPKPKSNKNSSVSRISENRVLRQKTPVIKKLGCKLKRSAHSHLS